MLTSSQRASYAERLRQGRQQAADGIVPRAPEAAGLPLSFAQEQLWFLDRFAPGLPTYNIPHALRLTGALDRAALGRALQGLVARHEALRTRFVTDAQDRPVQQVAEPVAVALPETELPGLEPAERAARLAQLAAQEAMEPFTLAEGFLFRCRLVRLAPDEHVLILVVHHIVFDASSLGVLLRDLAALYEAEAAGRPPALDPLPVQFADFALWERERIQGPKLDELTGFWRSAMAGFETLQLPTDRPRPPVAGFDGAVEWIDLGADVWAGVRELCHRERATPFAVVLAALQVLLHRYTGQDDVVVGTSSANRSRAELEPLIGLLVNVLPIRSDLSGDPTFLDLLGRVRETTIDAYAHQDLPFAKVIEALGVRLDPSRAPVFQVGLTYADAEPEVRAGGLTIHREHIDLPVSKFDLAFFAQVRGDRLWLEVSYSTALFDQPTVQRLLGNFRVLLAGAVADGSRRLSQLPVMTDAEIHRDLIEWNDTALDLPTGCVHEQFEHQVARTPDGIAAQSGAESVTYAQLNEQANRIARWLRELGVGREVLVGVCMAPSVRRLAVLLGIVKAGGGYVPLDQAFPADRLSFMMRDTAMPIVVADDAGAAALPQSAVKVESIDRAWASVSALDAHNPDYPVANSDTFYVIYTSGSTGVPKGVVVEHRHVVNHALGMVKQWSVGPGDRVLQFASLNFDVSVLDMFTALLSGACAVVASNETRLSPPRLAALIREQRVTFACPSPAVLNLLTGEQFPDLRVLMVAGEEFPAELAQAWLRPGLRLVNGYGPTEDTVIATFAELDQTTASGPPIGLPVANTQAYVLDGHLNPVPVGVIGELYLGGAGVARGYLNAPELTEQKFLPDPFRSDPGARLYRTGDLVRRLPDGGIMFVGRVDGQVKISGLRIELGEIETALAGHPAVAQAVAIVVEDRTGEKLLVAYARPVPGGPAPDRADLRQYLASRLPGYMVPVHIQLVDSFALNISGKIDKSALPAAELTGTTGLDPHVAPATLIELALVDMYADLLSRDHVGAQDGYFDLGGTSLQAMRLVARLQEDLAVDVAVATVFLAPSPRQLAAVLRDRHGLPDADLGEHGLEGLSDEETAALLAATE
jgi:amino acid adenylation domain-containing protein